MHDESRLITRKKIWEQLKIKLSQFTPEEIIERRRTIVTQDKRNSVEILPILDATLVMRRDTTPETVLEIKAPSTRSQRRKRRFLK